MLRVCHRTTATILAFSASSMHLAFFLAMFAQPMIPHLHTGLSIAARSHSVRADKANTVYTVTCLTVRQRASARSSVQRCTRRAPPLGPPGQANELMPAPGISVGFCRSWVKSARVLGFVLYRTSTRILLRSTSRILTCYLHRWANCDSGYTRLVPAWG